MIVSPPQKVLYCYGIYQPLFEVMERKLPFITFHQGLPTEKELNAFSDEKVCNLVALDDIMGTVTSS